MPIWPIEAEPSKLESKGRADGPRSGRLLTTPSSGGWLWSTAYAPYGETYASSGPSPVASFTGQTLWDTQTANYGFPPREYNGIQGRWWIPDPAGLAAVDPNNPQSWNRFAYVNGTPLQATDPLGPEEKEIEGDVSCFENPYDASCGWGPWLVAWWLSTGGSDGGAIGGGGIFEFQQAPPNRPPQIGPNTGPRGYGAKPLGFLEKVALTVACLAGMDSSSAKPMDGKNPPSDSKESPSPVDGHRPIGPGQKGAPVPYGPDGGPFSRADTVAYGANAIQCIVNTWTTWPQQNTKGAPSRPRG